MVATNAKWTKGEGNKGTLSFEIPVEVYQDGINKAFNKVKTQINMPGFRKGKMPKQLFIKQYGEESLYQDALNIILGDIYNEAIIETGISPVGQPDIAADEMEKDQVWKLHAEVEVAPEIELGDYQGLTVPKQSTRVTAKEVDAEIEKLRGQQAELVLKEDDAAVKGDTVVIDFDGSVNGDHFDGGKGENFSLELGSGQFIPGFEDQLIGHKADEDVEVKVSFPTDYQAEDLAGKEALFEVKIHEVKTKELPELDDEFAKDVDEDVNSLDELKTKTKAKIKEDKQQAAKDAKEEAALTKAVDNAKVVGDEIPASMIDEDVHRQLDQYLANMQQQGISPEMYYQLTGTSEADLHKQFEDGAEKRVKTNLVLEAIVAKENIEPTDADIDAEVKVLADQYGMDEAAVRQSLSPAMLKHDIAIKQVVDMIVDSAKEEA
ncbi:trigger factor [Periweissella beninensis]|uniref:trigger factor n=1 Tax=Periweissella beninensis TaxID=504936 RepID=UPI0021A615B4|nr:trigger factor [Periweissella beninensis]MCT4396777.1 trigger factor [Periweissella beninensis]